MSGRLLGACCDLLADAFADADMRELETWLSRDDRRDDRRDDEMDARKHMSDRRSE